MLGSVPPIAHDARGNLVDLRVGNKPETFAGESHEWKGWPLRRRQYVAAVDEELYIETRGCGCKSVARVALSRNERASEETSETACVHVDDAHERSSPPDDHEAERSSEWIRNLETFFWNSFRLPETEVRPWRSGNDSCDSMRPRVQTRFRTRSKQQYWHTTHKIQSVGGTSD